MVTDGDATRRLIAEVNNGNAAARSTLFERLYAELKGHAAAHLHGDGPRHSLQPTAVVNEAFLKIMGTGELSVRDRGHFFSVASQAMRQVLVDHARRRLADKRTVKGERVSLDVVPGDSRDPIDVIALDESIQRLASFDPTMAKACDLMFFAGMTVSETADTLGVAKRTFEREWRVARAWLHDQLV